MRQDFTHVGEEFGFYVFLFFRGNRGTAVLQQEDLVASVIGRPGCAFHADVCQEAAERDVLDAVDPEQEVEVGGVKSIECPFPLHHDVLLRRFQLIDDLPSSDSFTTGFGMYNPFAAPNDLHPSKFF